jgi:hypothetical protein
MKKRIYNKVEAVVVITILFLGTAILIPVNVGQESNPEIIELSFIFDQPVISPTSVNNTTYHQVRLDDSPIVTEHGVPLLPVKPVSVLVPQCGEVSSIDVDFEGNTSLGYDYNVELGILNDTLDPPSPNFNLEAPYPPGLFCDCGTNDFRGYSILTFVLHPVHYVADTGEIYYYERMDVTIATNSTGEVSPNFRGLPEDEMMMEQLVHNSVMVETYTTLPQHNYSTLVDPSDSYDYVIITSDDFDSTIEGEDNDFYDFVNYKNSIGTKTIIKTVDDIYEEFTDGRDDQENIREFIKEAYHGWGVEYVLLGGDHDIVPDREFYVFSGEDIFIPADLYYACLDDDFNEDNDSKWGEWIVDKPDLKAEVYIGRAPIGDENELKNFIYKTLKFYHSITI